MIIEIGTSDFRTNAGVLDGIYIEPVKYYYDRLPNNCIKENVAISNYNGTAMMYYIPLKVIEDNKLPNWLRGCNSINKIHPTVVKMGLSNYVRQQEVTVTRCKNIIDKHNVLEIDLLKIDTEGHDCIILNDYLDTVELLPNKIMFENNILSNQLEVHNTVDRLKQLGYVCEYVGNDVMCVLKEKK